VTDYVRRQRLADRYRLETYLGGTAAEVYLAFDEQLHRSVVIKIARSESVDYEAERFANEARLLADLSHPCLVTLYDAGVVSGRPYLVLQRVAGGTLAARIRQGPLPGEQAREVGRALAEALDYLHGRGVVHRDLKPSNVLLGADGVRLADLGIARLVDSIRITMTGLVVGTPAYLSPEQARGDLVGPASDLYSLGLTLLECLTGRREYDGMPVEAALARLSRSPVVPPYLPTPWPHLLARLTAVDPSDRPTAREVAGLLAAVGDLPTTRSLPVPPAGRGTRSRAAAAVVVAVAGSVVALAAMWPANDQPPAGGPASVPISRPATTSRPAPSSPAAPTGRPLRPASAVVTELAGHQDVPVGKGQHRAGERQHKVDKGQHKVDKGQHRGHHKGSHG